MISFLVRSSSSSSVCPVEGRRPVTASPIYLHTRKSVGAASAGKSVKFSPPSSRLRNNSSGVARFSWSG